MDLDEKAGKLEHVQWSKDRTRFQADCPLSNGAVHRIAVSKTISACLNRPACAKPLLDQFFANGTAHSNGKVEVSTLAIIPDLTSFRLKLHTLAKDLLFGADAPSLLAGTERGLLIDNTVNQIDRAIADNSWLIAPIPEQSETDRQEDVYKVAEAAVDAFLKEHRGAIAPAESRELADPIAWEGFEDALVANEEYLKRTPVIDKLCYSSAVSMITGGKHAGKSTLARWMAICVAKGYEFLKRQVHQGPVLYIASEDETMAARQELIRLGWTRNDALRFLPASKIVIDDQRAFLVKLTSEISKMQAVLVVVDMLFDFVPIADEMSYAGTREAVGLMQAVATGSGSHIVTIHHAPKNANIGDATVAALGSQGLAARVSPIILVRRFGPGVHSVSSTGVRDPRGESIMDSRLVRNEDGSVELGGAFKNYMLAEVYSGRVKEMLEDDPGSEMTAPEVSEALDISYEIARSCLSNMYRNGLIQRSGSGKKGKPYRYSVANTTPDDSKYPTSTIQAGYSESAETEQNSPIQKPFAYKDD